MTIPRTTARAAALLALAACAPADARRTAGDPAPPVSAATIARARGAVPATYGDFGIALYRQLAEGTPDGNVFVSPTSAGLALAMAMEGASGATRDSLAAMLGLAGADPVEATRRNAALLVALAEQEDVTLDVATAMWVRERTPLDSGFSARTRDGFGAEATALDLASPEAVARINGWASRATRGKIPVLLAAPLPQAAMLALTSAVYFKGSWAEAFDPGATTSRPFHVAGGTPVPVPMMHATGEYASYAGDGLRLARLPYRGGRFAMYVVLPDSGLAAMRRTLTPARLRAAMDSARPTALALALPRFRMEYAADLVAPLSALGAARAFDPRRAEFARMLDGSAAPRAIWLDRALQKTFVEVNEEGTEAAAVTMIVVADSAVSAGPIPFILDRPFMIVIRDDRTGELLFVGQVVNPLN